MGDFKPMTAHDRHPRRASRSSASTPAPERSRPTSATNNPGHAQPASTLDRRNAFERPVDVRVGPDGMVYVLDFGAFVVSAGEPKAFPKTGKLFRIEKR